MYVEQSKSPEHLSIMYTIDTQLNSC